MESEAGGEHAPAAFQGEILVFAHDRHAVALELIDDGVHAVGTHAVLAQAGGRAHLLEEVPGAGDGAGAA